MSRPPSAEVVQVAVGETVHFHGRDHHTGEYAAYPAVVVEVVEPFAVEGGAFVGGVVALTAFSVNAVAHFDEVEHGREIGQWSRIPARQVLTLPPDVVG